MFDTNSSFCFLFSATKPEQPISSVSDDIDALLEELFEEDDTDSPQLKVNMYFIQKDGQVFNHKNGLSQLNSTCVFKCPCDIQYTFPECWEENS